MKWTTEKPTVPGWYWAKWEEDGREFVIWVRPNSLRNNALDARLDGETYSLEDFHSFQGPIKPEEGE